MKLSLSLWPAAAIFSKGNFHNTRANDLKYMDTSDEREDYIDRALIDYAMASRHFEQAGHNRHSARVDNNHAMLLLDLGRYEEAHERLDQASRLFVLIEDAGSIAQVDETRARILLAQDRPGEALNYARSAVKTFEKGDEQALLCEALTTCGIALARLSHHGHARLTFKRAIETGKAAGDAEGAGRAVLTLIEEMRAHLSFAQLCRSYRLADELLNESQHPLTLERLRICARHVLSSRQKQPEHFALTSQESNLYRFPVARVTERFSIHVLDEALSADGIHQDDVITFRLSRQYQDGDLVFALTPGGWGIGFISIIPDGRRRLGSKSSVSSRCYLAQEVIVLGVAEQA